MSVKCREKALEGYLANWEEGSAAGGRRGRAGRAGMHGAFPFLLYIAFYIVWLFLQTLCSHALFCIIKKYKIYKKNE